MFSKMSIFFWMILLTNTKRYEQACVQISPESQWYVLDPRFPQDREVIVWIKISLEIDGHWGTAPTCTDIPPSQILMIIPHTSTSIGKYEIQNFDISCKLQVLKWLSGATPAEAPRWGKTGGSTARRPPRMFFILYDGAPVCTRQLQITNRRTNKVCRRRLQLLMGWAHSLSITLAPCTHLMIFKCCEQLD